MAEIKHEIQPDGIAEPVDQYVPSVYIEISEEQMDMLEVDADVVLTLKGRIVGLNSSKRDSEDGRYEIQMEMQEVLIDPDENEFSKLLDEDEK